VEEVTPLSVKNTQIFEVSVSSVTDKRWLWSRWVILGISGASYPGSLVICFVARCAPSKRRITKGNKIIIDLGLEGILLLGFTALF